MKRNGAAASTRRLIFGFISPLGIIGLTRVLNLLLLVSLSPFVALNPGRSGDRHRWWLWKARCKGCAREVTWDSGIFCANFGTTRGAFDDCCGAWCASCYRPHPLDDSEVREPQDFEGESLARPEDKDRFRTARGGDHTMCCFQCKRCQFRNLKGRSPRGEIIDQALVSLIRRANLDAFWSRTPGTLQGHRGEVRKQLRYGQTFGLDMFPPLGPRPLGDDNGMKQAIGLILRSKEPGKDAPTAKYSTTRKARGAFTNFWNASPASGGDITMSDKGKHFVPLGTRWKGNGLIAS